MKTADDQTVSRMRTMAERFGLDSAALDDVFKPQSEQSTRVATALRQADGHLKKREFALANEILAAVAADADNLGPGLRSRYQTAVIRTLRGLGKDKAAIETAIGFFRAAKQPDIRLFQSVAFLAARSGSEAHFDALQEIGDRIEAPQHLAESLTSAVARLKTGRTKRQRAWVSLTVPRDTE